MYKKNNISVRIKENHDYLLWNINLLLWQGMLNSFVINEVETKLQQKCPSTEES